MSINILDMESMTSDESSRALSFALTHTGGKPIIFNMLKIILISLLLAPAPLLADTNATTTTTVAEDSKSQALRAYFRDRAQLQITLDKNVVTRFQLAAKALESGDGQTAKEQLEGLQKQLPEIHDYIVAMRARALTLTGELDEAQKEWMWLVKHYRLSKHAVDAYYALADLSWREGENALAKTYYEAALKREKRSDRAAVARYNLALMAEREKRFDDAAETWANLAYIKIQDPFSELAREHHEKLVTQRKAKAPSFYFMAEYAGRLIDKRLFEKSAAVREKLAEDANTVSRMRKIKELQGVEAYKKKDYQLAKNYFASLAEENSGAKRQEYQYWLARTFSSNDEKTEAIKLYQALSKSYGKRQDARKFLFKAAWMAFNAHEHRLALQLFDEYIRQYPDDGSVDSALWFKGWNAWRLGDFPVALQTFQELNKRFPRSSLTERSDYWQGRALFKMGKHEEGTALFAKLLTKTPFSYYAVMARQRLEQAGKNLDDLLRPEDLQEAIYSKVACGKKIFDWKQPSARRLIQLWSLGLEEDAARLVRSLKVRDAVTKDDEAYSRARLYFALNAYHSSFRRTVRSFGRKLKALPTSESLPVFRMAYPDAHRSLVQSAALEFELSPNLIYSVMRQESAFMTLARSWASARGLMQVIPPTGEKIAEHLEFEDFDPDLLNKPEVNIRFGAWYLSQLLEKYSGQLIPTICSYNAGPKAVTNWLDRFPELANDEFIEEIPYKETRGYVKRVLGNLAVYQMLYEGKWLQTATHVPKTYKDNIMF